MRLVLGECFCLDVVERLAPCREEGGARGQTAGTNPGLAGYFSGLTEKNIRQAVDVVGF
jgi:hypothetical protein